MGIDLLSLATESVDRSNDKSFQETGGKASNKTTVLQDSEISTTEEVVLNPLA